MKERDATDWEELARREPYFAILTNEGSVDVIANASATAAFFDTGESDIATLLAAITSLLGRDLRLTRTLDFGCGVGRLTLPLARRSTQVIGCDITPTILVHARQNAQSAGLQNVTFIGSESLSGEFDFICSLLVFEHIPRPVGYELLGTLANMLAPGGVAALQMKFRGRGGDYDERVVLRQLEAAGAHVIAQLPTRHDGSETSAILIVDKHVSD